MNWNLLILIFGVLLNNTLGLIVALRNPKSATNTLFFLFSIDIAVWSVANYIAISSTDLLTALYWTRIVMALAVPQAILFFLLLSTIPNKQLTLPRWVPIFLAVIGICAAVASVSPYLFTSIIFVNGSPSPTPGPAMPLFVVVAVGSLVAGVMTLWNRLRRSSGVLRLQLQIIGIGIVCMFVLIFLFNFIFVVVFNISSYVSASPLYTLPFVAATAYAIIKHKFLDIRFIIARAVSYAVVISLFAVVYALLFALTSSFLISPFIDLKFIGVSTAAAIVMLITFPLVKRTIEKATDAVFYKDKYDTSAVLYHVAQIMARTLRLEELAHQLVMSIDREFQTEHACIILVNHGKIVSMYTDGYDKPPEVHEHAASYISALGKVRLRDDEKDPQIAAFFASLDAAIILPLETGQRAIGLLCIGNKRSGELFSDEDVSTLEIIASEAAVATENSLSYEEIRRFNVTLEDEVKSATVDLRRANEKLEQLDKLKDEFVSLASHELRTPLTSIRSYLWMALSGKGGDVSEKQRFYLDRAFLSADRLIRLVNDMLNISRIESGRLAVQFSRAELPNMLNEVLSEVQPKIDEQGQTLHVQIAAQELPDVIADVDKIKEVLINFIGNAIKFTPKGGSITVAASRQGDMVAVSVKDTGLGFLMTDAAKLFHKFSTVHSGSNSDSAPYQSTGLGLYISKSIISIHGGTVEAVSPGIDKGSTFSFTLPVYTPAMREQLQRKYVSDGLGIIHSSID